MTRRCLMRSIVVLLVFIGCSSRLDAEDALAKRATWKISELPEVKEQLDQWLASTETTAQQRQKVDELWNTEPAPAPGIQTLERLASCIALIHPDAAALVQLCQDPELPLSHSNFPFLEEDQPEAGAWMRANLRLLYSRWLAQNSLYDEVLEQLDGLRPEDVVDPASLLFYQAVAHHRLLHKQQCLDAITRLLEQRETIPQRYLAVARLMEADIKPLETDSLDEVARLMDDVRRRLDLGRAGKQVRQQEDDVIAKLDKMIEQLEQQQQQQQAAAAAGPGSGPNNPLPDSVPVQQKGPGNVDPKDIGQKSGWGNLPPKERQEALQQISKELPAHYREVIEEYFRKLARDGGE